MKISLLLTTVLPAFLLAAASVRAEVTLEHVRNATSLITYGETTFLIDPMLAEKDRYPGFEGCFNPEVRNPKTQLPKGAAEILDGVDAVIVSHTHLDHWDEAAQQVIPKEMPLFVQDEKDAADIRAEGFTNVTVMNPSAEFGGVTLTHVEGTHGTQEMYDDPAFAALLGETMGILFSAPGEKTTYLMGDTVWTPRVSKTLRGVRPEIVVMNTGYAKALGFNEGIIMGTADVARAAAMLPDSVIVTVHMDAINHCTVSRKNMRDFLEMTGLAKQVLVPEDGEVIPFK